MRKLTSRRVDRAIRNGECLRLYNVLYSETFDVSPVSRHKGTFQTATGGLYDIRDLYER